MSAAMQAKQKVKVKVKPLHLAYLGLLASCVQHTSTPRREHADQSHNGLASTAVERPENTMYTPSWQEPSHIRVTHTQSHIHTACIHGVTKKVESWF